ncbi:hypothetical protein CN311_16790 [Mesorhizobium sanjuanii]|uniref:Uncharacterized protein n=1 Tax=Mesorhizobium sanjuanii TaxID=2037900 RepID=A0A2A6FD78_9HYPH|nr:hypothetical protein CN311_16790 [Mesorhizobium sanjuanii]
MASDMGSRALAVNPLAVLDAPLTQRNLTVTARSIDLSEPAMSAGRGHDPNDLLCVRARRLSFDWARFCMGAPQRKGRSVER